MADKKISQLPDASTPLAGTETLPIVQGGATDKVTVADLTAGRAVTALSLTATDLTPSKPVFTDASDKLVSTGTVPTDQGGTGLTSFTANGVVYASSTSALTTGSALNFTGSYLGLGVAGSGQYNFRQLTTGSGTTSQFGYHIDAFSDASATAQTCAIRARARTSNAAYTCSQVFGVLVDNPGLGTGSTISGAAGVVVTDHTVGSSYNRALLLQVSSGTNKHNIYASGTAANYFAGGVNVGATTDPGANNLWVSGNINVRGSGGLGYGTGSGGAVTQTTSRTNGVTLDKTNGAITLVSAAGSATWQTFTVTNSTVAATDTVIVSQKSGTDLYQIFVTAVAGGSFDITFATTGGTTTEQPVFNFAVIKAVTA